MLHKGNARLFRLAGLCFTAMVGLCLGAKTCRVNGVRWNYTVSYGVATIGVRGEGKKGKAVPESTTGEIRIPAVLDRCPVMCIEDGAFYGCTGLTRVIIPQGVRIIGDGSFFDCSGLTELTLPSTVVGIGSHAFFGCRGLTNLTIHSAQRIGHNAFMGCSGLTGVTIPANTEKICGQAFDGCCGLTNVTISSSVREIESSAFRNCTGLTKVVIPSRVRSLEPYAFSGCGGITAFTVDADNWFYRSVDGMICSKDGRTLLFGVNGEVSIPSHVTNIWCGAFHGCRNLKKVVIPPSVRKIESNAFDGCWGLTSVTIPPSVTNLEWRTFGDCRSLTSVTIPSGFTRIDCRVFDGCSSLTNVTIPASVTRIGSTEFNQCPLSTVHVYGERKGWTMDALPKPTRAGYRFKGWRLAEKGDRTGAASPEAMRDVTYTAQWEKIPRKELY